MTAPDIAEASPSAQSGGLVGRRYRGVVVAEQTSVVRAATLPGRVVFSYEVVEVADRL